MATTTPVGRCVMRTAELVVLTCCPPAPPARYVSMRRSSSRTTTSAWPPQGITNPCQHLACCLRWERSAWNMRWERTAWPCVDAQLCPCGLHYAPGRPQTGPNHVARQHPGHAAGPEASPVPISGTEGGYMGLGMAVEGPGVVNYAL